MQLSCKLLLAAVVYGLALSSAALAETKVTMKGVHLCCPMCLSAVDEVMGNVQGAKAKPDQQGKTIAITADNDEAAQKALDKLAEAGFHGKIDNDKLKFKTVEAPKGQVKKLEITGIHNCCGACTRTIKAAVKNVKGVTSDTVAPRQTAFVVEGDFSATELVDALLGAGFHCQLKK